jgi:hypothetical protein
MNLLDRAIKLAAEQENEDLAMNFVRKHALETAEELGVSLREASTRVFSNASGSYSSNVNLAVENSSWNDESQLQEMCVPSSPFLLLLLLLTHPFSLCRPSQMLSIDTRNDIRNRAERRAASDSRRLPKTDETMPSWPHERLTRPLLGPRHRRHSALLSSELAVD